MTKVALPAAALFMACMVLQTGCAQSPQAPVRAVPERHVPHATEAVERSFEPDLVAAFGFDSKSRQTNDAVDATLAEVLELRVRRAR